MNSKRLSVIILFLFACSLSNAASLPTGAIRDAAQMQGGLIVHVGCGGGRSTVELCGNTGIIVHALDSDAANVERARGYIQSIGLYGRVSVEQFDGKNLPYIDNLVNMIIAENTKLSNKEILRALRPLGTAYINGKKITKPWPDDIDEWSHYLRNADNNAVSQDSKVGPPRHMQYLSGPIWTRHHDKLASVSAVVTARGRLFYIIDNASIVLPNHPSKWSLTARDAFNGALLWKRDIPKWVDHMRKFRSGPVQIQRLVVADDERLFATLSLGSAISVLDAATGKTLSVLEGTENTEEILFHNGVIVALVGTEKAEQALTEGLAKSYNPETKKIVAIDPDSGKTLWQWPENKTADVMPKTLTADGDKLFFQSGNDTVCISVKSGKTQWRTQIYGSAAAVGKTSGAAAAKNKRRSPKQKPGKKNSKKAEVETSIPTLAGRKLGWTYATVLAKDGVVLSSSNKIVFALDAETGKKLWQCEAASNFGRTPELDIFIIDGKVWTSPTFSQAYDLHTGEIVSENNLQEELVTAGHHHRCYRNKATVNFIIQGHRGLEFRNLDGDEHFRHNWIRGLCQYGILPANGLVYIPPHNCGCYSEALLHGFWTLSAEQSSFSCDDIKPGGVLQRGPVYGKANSSSGSDDAESWPVYRYDGKRSGATSTKLSKSLSRSWQVDLGGDITAPVIAGDTVVIGSKDTCQVVAMDINNGTKKWSYTTGGGIDSAPTIYGDMVLFGSADGCVYCVTLDSGELIWKFRAVDRDLKTIALEKLESIWPVHGSVLIKNDTAYFTAGRSSYLDGGILMYGLDPKTGKVKHQQQLNDEHPGAMKPKDAASYSKKIQQNVLDFKTFLAADKSDSFSMRGGNLSDILVAGDDEIFLRHMAFDDSLKQQQDKRKFHLYSTSTLLDDNEAHRSHWFYGKGDLTQMPVAYEWLTRGAKDGITPPFNKGGYSSPYGKLLVFDENAIWGLVTIKDEGRVLYVREMTTLDHDDPREHPVADESQRPARALLTLDVHPRAMVKAGSQLILGGFKNDQKTPIEESANYLMQLSATDGQVSSKIELKAGPVFDGMAAAYGKLFVSDENGTITCYK